MPLVAEPIQCRSQTRSLLIATCETGGADADANADADADADDDDDADADADADATCETGGASLDDSL